MRSDRSPDLEIPSSRPVDHPRRWAILAVMALAVFVVSIDATILNVALPTISRELHAGTSALQWMVDAYSVALAGLLLMVGSLSDRLGRKRVLLTGLLIFGAASAAAALATNSGELIAARAVMGAGASAFMPGTLSILTQVFSEESRPKAIGIWGAVTALGAVAGPLIGGVLMEHFWWGSMFLVNVIVVGLAFLGALILVPESCDRQARPVDPISCVLSVAGISAVVYAIIEQPQHGWSSRSVYLPLVAGLVGLLLFWLRQVFARHPMVDLAIVRSRLFLGSCGTMAILMFGLTGSLFVLTQQFQLNMGYGPLLAGAAILPVAGSLMVFSGLSAAIGQAVGPRLTVSVALLVLAGGYGVIAEFTDAHGYVAIAAGLVLVGAGMGLAQPIVNDTLMGSGPTEKSGLISSMNDTVQELGSALGVAVIGSVLAARYAAALPGHGHSFATTVTDAQLRSGSAGDLLLAASKHAFAHSFTGALLVIAAVIVAGALLALVLLPGRRTGSEIASSEQAETRTPVSVG